jgi:hypothetical protein
MAMLLAEREPKPLAGLQEQNFGVLLTQLVLLGFKKDRQMYIDLMGLI